MNEIFYNDLKVLVRSHSPLNEFRSFAEKYIIELAPYSSMVEQCMALVNKCEQKKEENKNPKNRKRKTLEVYELETFSSILNDLYNKIKFGV